MSLFFHDIIEIRNKNSENDVFIQNRIKKGLKFQFAIVEDNEDPDNKARIKVRFPQWNIKSDWVPLIRPYSGDGEGIYFIPEKNDLVICLFVNNNPGKAIVLGAIKRTSDNNLFGCKKLNNINAIVTRSGLRIILDNSKKEEKIIIRTEDSKIRVVIDKNKGFEIKNELGDIRIRCRKLKIKNDNLLLGSDKKIKIRSDKSKININTKKSFNIRSEKQCVMVSKGIISLNGMLTAENKAAAKCNDQVAGIDMHLVEARIGSATVAALLPHPYIGKIRNKLSSDVFNNNLSVAYKGSKSEHVLPGHIPTPPGEKFTKGKPSGIGEITSGTINSVLVNNREIAVSGSLVRTCNDPANIESSFVLAQGLPVTVPVMMSCIDDMIYESDGGFMINSRDIICRGKKSANDKKPEINKACWGKDKAQTGEELILNAELENQYEMAQVIFKIWNENADFNKDLPLAVLKSRCINNKAEIKYRHFINELVFENDQDLTGGFMKEQLGIDVSTDSFKLMIEDYDNDFENPVKKAIKLFFTAESFRCEMFKSGFIEIGDYYEIEFYKPNGEKLENVRYSIRQADGKKIEELTSSDGNISKKAQIPGRYQIKFKKE